MDITVEDITSDSPAPKTTGETSAIYNDTHHLPNAFNAFALPVDASRIASGTQVDDLDSASSKISIDTASMTPGADDQELDTEGDNSVPTVLTVAWWQWALMRILPLNSRSTIVNNRLLKSSTRYSKSTSWWRGISTKNPSADQVNRACGKYRLVYLRTTDVLNVGKLRSSLRRHCLYIEAIIFSPSFHLRPISGKPSLSATTSTSSLVAPKLVTMLSKRWSARGILSPTFENPLSLA